MNEEQIVKDHAGMVKTIARSFQNCGLPLEDLEQEANIALVLAARKWSKDREAALSTYAFHQIIWALCNTTRRARQQRRHGRSVSMDAPLVDDVATLHDVVGTDPTQLDAVEASDSCGLLDELDTVARKIVVMHVLEGKDVRSIASALGCSKSQVSRVYREALDTMRKAA
jgi:RNA polymerase sigma factor (sigma-70 family)